MSKVYDALGPDGFGAYQVAWNDGQPSFERVHWPPQGLLIPGFVDLHIHGAFGIDFMSCAPEEIDLLCTRLESEGYEGFLPTTVTADAASVRAAIAKITQNEMILGFHLEGPFISPEFPGAQPQEFITDPPWEGSEWDEVLADPRLRIVTLAPERNGALALISRLSSSGVIASMGHTDATYDEARRGFEYGITHVTHTFNAMRPFHHREAGTVGYALQNDSLNCELIYDRHHVVRRAASLLFKLKGPERVIAISDGTLASGMLPGTTLEMWGRKCIVDRGTVRLEDGTLAGSSITLLDAFRNLYEDFGPEIAISACCLNPRRALGLTEPPRVWLELDGKLGIARRIVRSSNMA